MVSGNWFLIHLTGRTMVVSLMLSAANLVFGGSQNNQIYSPTVHQEADRSGDIIPLMGVFTRDAKGKMVLHMLESDIDDADDIICLTPKNGIFNIKNIKQLALKDNLSKINGELQDCINNKTIYLYTCDANIDKTKSQESMIGIILRRSCVISKTPDSSDISIKFKHEKYFISRQLSSEGVHFKCFINSTKNLKLHLYYYLDYNVDSGIK